VPDYDDLIEQAAGRLCCDSGIGFGERDMTFKALDEPDARRLAARVEAVAPGVIEIVVGWEPGEPVEEDDLGLPTAKLTEEQELADAKVRSVVTELRRQGFMVTPEDS
jgi:hypothetical protein